MTHLDVGAFIGLFTRHMARDAGRVIAFEPDPDTRAVLQANIASLSNVQIEAVAVGTSDGTVPLYRNPRHGEGGDHPSTNSLLASNPLIAGGSTVQVRRVDFMRYVMELGEDVGVVKIDIEGGEVELLEALFDRPDVMGRIRNLFIETHERVIPALADRVDALWRRAQYIEGTHINFGGPRVLAPAS